MDLTDIMRRADRLHLKCDMDPARAATEMTALIADVEDSGHGRDDLRSWTDRARGQMSHWRDRGRDRVRLWAVIFDARIHLREIHRARTEKAGTAPARETAPASGW